MNALFASLLIFAQYVDPLGQIFMKGLQVQRQAQEAAILYQMEQNRPPAITKQWDNGVTMEIKPVPDYVPFDHMKQNGSIERWYIDQSRPITEQVKPIDLAR